MYEGAIKYQLEHNLNDAFIKMFCGEVRSVERQINEWLEKDVDFRIFDMKQNIFPDSTEVLITFLCQKKY